MYRALAVTAMDRRIPLDDGDALARMAASVEMKVADDGGVFRVWVDGVEVTLRLRDPSTDRAVKVLATVTPVRRVLVSIQRELAKPGGVVMEGRDIGSVVMPDADVKVFLTADLTERARRRWQELRMRGIEITWEEVLEELKSRDQKDLEREWGRLVMVEDAVLIDSTRMTVEEVCNAIIRLCEEKQSCSTES